MQNTTFSYNYSASRNKEIEAIRNRYIQKEESPVDKLKALDLKARRPACVFAYVFGGISAVIMGAGMSLVMTDIGSLIGIGAQMPLGIVIGIVGMAMSLINYPLHKAMLKNSKKKYAAEILTLSESIINN